jgi:hypothetical protein
MARKFAVPIDMQQLEILQLILENRASNPASGKEGQAYYNTSTDKVVICTATGTPGTWTNMLFGPVTTADILDGTITDVDVNALNKDGAAGTPSLRTLGTGANQAAPGNDARFGAATPPNGPAGGDLSGTYPNPQIAAGVITDADVNALNKDGTVSTLSLRTLGSGATQAMPGNRTLDAINAAVANVNMGGQKLVSLGTPTNPADGTTKAYVDGLVQGVEVRDSVRAASTGNVSLAAPGANLDGIALAVGNRILLKDQTAPAENGIYIWNGAAAAATRAPDTDAWTELVSAFTFVEQGTANADSGWLCTVDQGGTIGTTAVTWVQFSGAGQLTAGAGLTKTGNTVDVGAGAGITVNADNIQIANDGVTNAMMADSSVNLAGADVFNTLPLTKGGTGGTSAATARTSLGTPGYYSNNAVHTAATPISIPAATHGLGAGRNKIVQVRDEATGDQIEADTTVAANGDVSIGFASAPAANAYRVLITGW